MRRMRGDPGQGVGQPSLRVDAVHLGGDDQSLRHGRRAVDQDTIYVAFDTSKEQLAVAIAEGGRRKEVRFFGTIASRPEAVVIGLAILPDCGL